VAAEKTSVEIVIEAQNRAGTAMNQAITDQKRFADEMKRTQAVAANGQQTAAQTVRTLNGQQEAMRRLSAETTKLQSQGAALTTSQNQLQQAMAGVTQGLENQAGGVGRFVAALGPVGGAIAAGIGALTAFGLAAVGAAKRLGDYQEAADIAAEQTGLTVQEIGGLRVAASNVGRDFESIQPSLSIFVRNIGEAADGSDTAVKAFDRLGISVKDQATGAIRPTGEILKEVAARFNAIQDPAARARSAFELFGRGASSILPILAQNLTAAEDLAQKLGITLSPAMQKVARDADAAGDKFKLSFMGAMNQITATLAPTGTAILNFATSAIENFRKLGEFIREHTVGAFQELEQTAQELKGPDPSKAGVTVGQISVVNPGPTEQAKELTKQAREQLFTLQKSIPLLDYQRSIGAITAQQEIQKLESLKGQALTAREILTIEQKIAALSALVPDAGRGTGVKTISGVPVRGLKVEGDQGDPGADTEFIDAIKEMHHATADASESAKDLGKNLTDANSAMSQSVIFAKELGKTLAHDVIGGWQSIVHAFVSGTGSIGKAFSEMVQKMIETIATQVTVKLIASAIGLPLPFAQGGLVHAASGLVTSGLQGRDSTLALLQPQERVLSVRRNDEFEGLLTKLNGMLSAQAMTRPDRAAAAQRPNVTLNLTVNGSLADERSLKTLVDERIAPLVGRALATNSVR
jgi:hypothetical protein